MRALVCARAYEREKMDEWIMMITMCVCVCVCDDNVTIVMKTMDESMDGDDHDVCVSKRHKKPQGQRRKTAAVNLQSTLIRGHTRPPSPKGHRPQGTD